MGSATTFDAGTEQFLIPDAGVRMDLQPFAWDERIIWAFQRGLANHGPNEQDLITFLNTILTWEGRAIFSAGFVVGVGEGAYQAVKDYVQFVVRTVKLFVSAAEEAKIVFDGNLVAGSIAVYLTAPGSAERAAALEKVAEYFDQNYPEVATAFRSAEMVGLVLEAVAEWLGTPGAVGEIAVAISGVLGQVAGTLLDGVRPYLNDPLKLGRGMGFMVGQLLAWMIFDEIGLPFSIFLDIFESLLETVIETGKAH